MSFGPEGPDWRMPLVGQELTKEKNEVAVSGLLKEWRKGSCPKDRKRENELKMIKLPTFSSSLNSKYLGYLALVSTA